MEIKLWRPFIVSLSIVIILFGIGLLLGLSIRSQQLVDAQILAEARSHFDSILLTRRWNAGYGGVYVEKKPGVMSNPYLKNPDFHSVDGKIYTKKNPALMTREISELNGSAENFKFNITSLRPINPDNTPDQFEAEALKLFDEGKEEVYKKQESGGKTLFRYMAPLVTEKSCLQCHGEQGYREGEVRGGISVTTDISKLLSANKKITTLLVSSGIFLIIAVLGFSYVFIYKLMKVLRNAHDEIEFMAVTDLLTGLPNRRSLMENLEHEFRRCNRYGSRMSVLMMDIDNFKLVNDTYGHAAGDKVLAAVGGILRSSVRSSDVNGRYGGEEFCSVLIETDVEESFRVAEKIRKTIENTFIDIGSGQMIQITLSIGIANYMAPDMMHITKAEELLNFADKALYKAKEEGRNKTVEYPLNWG